MIVPDGPLHALPFDMLVAPSRSKLAQTAAITFAPSASVFRALRSREIATKPLPLLAVGGVPYGDLSKRGNPSRAISIFDARITPHLEALPASRTEVEMALNMAGPAAVGLLGQDATEGHFKRQPLERFGIIHLAVHAFADPRQPQRGALLFAQEKSSEEDGFLQPREIVRLPIKANLVVLSACNTTVGRSLGQEGVSNLARAFLSSGATAVLATSWSVSDTASGSLLTEFYRNLAQGRDMATCSPQCQAHVLDARSERSVNGRCLPGDRKWKCRCTVWEKSHDSERSATMSITQEQMTGTLDRIQHSIRNGFFNPLADIAGWTNAWRGQRDWLLASTSGAEFVQRVNVALATLKSSHVAFFHGRGPGVPAPYALNATFLKAEDPELIWLFLDVLEGGVAHKAGIQPGEALLSVNGSRVLPPEVPRFDLRSQHGDPCPFSRRRRSNHYDRAAAAHGEG